MTNKQYIQSNTSDRQQDELAESRDKLNENNIYDGPRYYTHPIYRPKEEKSQEGDFDPLLEQEWDWDPISARADYNGPDAQELQSYWNLLEGRET